MYQMALALLGTYVSNSFCILTYRPWPYHFADEGLGTSLSGPTDHTAYTETKFDADGSALTPTKLVLKGQLDIPWSTARRLLRVTHHLLRRPPPTRGVFPATHVSSYLT